MHVLVRGVLQGGGGGGGGGGGYRFNLADVDELKTCLIDE